MPRKISYVPTAPDRGSVATIPAAEIPVDVIAEVEEVYAALKANPNGRMRAEFDTKAELNTYMTQVMSYCRQRQVNGELAPLRFRKSPTKNLPETTMDYRIGDPLPDKDAIDTPTDGPAAPATPIASPAAEPAEAPTKVGKVGKK
jgi:hypothetical protein